ncbi:uncharacterized protein LOC112164591 isoform X4 [Rosa chinensis]|uniref:uncharacterized protein LOC112164591 isoform X4 n=1 Tax=Rosa chinensis TaxID=74649 RepID=UPI001AD8EAED|nr:uncharacterized protein LOC112164591 isoform X4 [Rosa chinensis]XP_040362349.1 uncharacterized protein LOC112164591 isoform X4 [Rosa chinensis]
MGACASKEVCGQLLDDSSISMLKIFGQEPWYHCKVWHQEIHGSRGSTCVFRFGQEPWYHCKVWHQEIHGSLGSVAAGPDFSMIGQFGVGFYFAYLVVKKEEEVDEEKEVVMFLASMFLTFLFRQG